MLRDPAERHSFPDNVTEWEDPLVLVYTKWRDFRDSLPNKTAWMTYCRSFVNLVCEKWGLLGMKNLAVSTDVDRIEPAGKTSRTTAAQLEDRPSCHGKAEGTAVSVEWAQKHGCFLFIVDCKPLAEVINGHAHLFADELENIVDGTLSNIEYLLDSKWMPSGLRSDPIRWAPRASNVVADYLGNHSMDSCKAWQEVFDVTLPKEYNLILHIDGGARKTCGSAAWIVEATFLDDGVWKMLPIAMSATYCNGKVSSFTAKALAPYYATSFLQCFIRKE